MLQERYAAALSRDSSLKNVRVYLYTVITNILPKDYGVVVTNVVNIMVGGDAAV